MSRVEQYLGGLQKSLSRESREELSCATGATLEQLSLLRQVYPLCPVGLQQLLGKINGTHWQTYHGQEIAVLILGSDVFEYPYYLRSVEQILGDYRQGKESIADIYGKYLEEEPEMVDPRIDPTVRMGERLCFSYCMNNGGTSRLYVDFSPGLGGKQGQIIRFLHDPDEYKVIADSFDEYLLNLMNDEYSFLNEE